MNGEAWTNNPLVENNPVVVLWDAPTAQFHHQSWPGSAVKCRACQGWTIGWSDHLRRHHIGMTTVFLADHLRDVARWITIDLSYGLDPVDRIMAAMDRALELGVDDASDGLATLAMDVMLGRVTGSRVVSALHGMADEMAPLPHLG